MLSRVITPFHQGVCRMARQYNWHLTSSLVFEQPKLLEDWRGDGIITSLGSDPILAEFIQKQKIPVVDLVNTRPDILLPRFSVDDSAVAKLAFDHFKTNGYRHFAFWGHPGYNAEKIRRRAYTQLIESSSYPASFIVLNDHPNSRSLGYESLMNYLGKKLTRLPKPCAIFCFNDTGAAEISEACQLVGLRIPHDIAILGVNNNELASDSSPIPLSSIEPALRQRAEAAAEALQKMMSGEQIEAREYLLAPSGLICRASSDYVAYKHQGLTLALEYIRQHFKKPVNVENVVRHSKMGRRGLEKVFNKYLGRSILCELQRLRMEEAKSLLSNTLENIEDILSACGFVNTQAFYRCFKKSTGKTPATYRKDQKKGP